MAPKSAQKSKVKKEATPPPTPPPKKAKPPTTPVSTPAKKPKKEPVVFKTLARDKSQTIPIDVAFEGSSATSKLGDDGTFTHTLKLSAAGAFTLTKTFMLSDGEYDGMQAIVIRPAKAFNFLGLPEEVRARIYHHYFATSGTVNIALDGKRKANNEVYAKTYANGNKHRVALLRVNKEIHAKAMPIFYSHPLLFENTSVLMEFLSNIRDVRPHLSAVIINTWIKTTAKTAMGILAESPRIKELKVEAGIANDADPGKAAKHFYEAAYKFLEAVGAAKGDPEAAVDVLVFGKKAFKTKDEKKKIWDEDEIEEFREALREKLRT